MDHFFATIAAFTPLSPEGKTALSAIIKQKEVAKGQILVKAHTVCNSIFYIRKGLTRTCYYKDGKDVTDWISTEGQFACSIVSFISRQPDRREIETLEDSLLFEMRFDDLERLYKQYHELEHLGRVLVSSGLIQLQQRFDDLHFATAKERYARLLHENPDLLLRVPLGMLASYLGITQETLSRIRSGK
jgi:CRP-like cAMP-binding protein